MNSDVHGHARAKVLWIPLRRTEPKYDLGNAQAYRSTCSQSVILIEQQTYLDPRVKHPAILHHLQLLGCGSNPGAQAVSLRVVILWLYI